MLGPICITQEPPHRLLHTDPEKGRMWNSNLESPRVYCVYIGRHHAHTMHTYTHAVIQYVTMHACTIQTHTHTDHVYIYILIHCRGRRTSDPAIYCVKHSHERTMYGCSHLEFPLTSDGLSAASQLPVNSQPYNHHTYSVWGENSLIYIKYNKNS